MRFLVFLLFLSLYSNILLNAQEFDATVTINTPTLSKATPELFEALESSIADYFNNTKWTDDIFEPIEKIKLQVQIVLTEEISDTRFKTDFQIQASRPIYNSDQETVTFTHRDKGVVFDYQQYQPLIFSQNSYQNQLTSLLSYYAFTILGMDYDSFSERGGQEYFKRAEEVMNSIPNSAITLYKGWRAADGNRNRYWLNENLLSPRIRPMREAMYEYHRIALDNMHENVDEARGQMTAALSKVDNSLQAYPNAMIFQIFALSKRSEIIEIYKAAPSDEKKFVRELMIKIDPSSAAIYQKIGF